ncbi:MAG TPA: DUF2007 domain-containing protein [Bacteroidales bacterium]|jgi:hypothetical protein|nr:DUF2007 domain-containing protein [Bacteroidales bacterium]MDX9906097.1 DUF2007 domain-containing protein [Bacteroidales bacterium]HOX76776.1 DUF2007 domain-containing protein [Bacteroidales bacterium]HPI86916.1 DUF2007 domain-containing protein [Bacteroidales bacterium]HPM91532.1 DUF2007 domain-containing protein [Bacteroidales bacterium]
MPDDPVTEIFSGTLWEAELLQTMLNDNEIDCFLKNSTLNTFVFEPTFAGGVKVMVLQSNLVKATEIVNEFRKNIEKA